MKKTNIKHRLSTVIRVLFSVSLMVLVLGVGNTVLGDNLATAEGEGSSTTTTTDVYIPVASATVNVGTNVTEVMVVATFEVMALIKQGHLGRFRLKNNTNTAYSQVIERYLERATDGDKGIGSIVYIFDVPSGSGNTEFILEHATSSGSYNNTTSGTIVAIAMGTTTSGIPLGNDVKSITTAVSPTTTDTWEVVTGLTTDAVSLPADGEIFIATSINTNLSGGTNQTGEWKLQQKKGSGAWEDIGLSVTRSLNSPGDVGITSLGMMITGLTRGDYYFQLLHKGTGLTVQTLNTSLIAVALTYLDGNNVGHAFPAFKTSLASKTTTSDTLEPALSQQGTPISNTDMFLYAQYKMTAVTGFDSPTFDMYLVDDSHSNFYYSSMDQQRRLNGTNDSGSGASVGLAANLKEDSTYTASLRHASNGTITLTTSSMILSGFQTTDYICGGYWTGGASGNETQWNNTANWACGNIPTSSTNVTLYDKTYEPVIAAGATCNSLDILEDATLTVNTGQTLTVSGDLVVESGGSFISNGTTTASGVIATRYVAKDIWHYISSPVNGQAINGTFMTENDVYSPNSGTNYNFYRWDEPTNTWYIYGDGSFGDGSFVNGRGYAATFATDRYIEYTGTLNTGDKTITVYKTGASGYEGSNLLGNPFLSPISLSDFTNSSNNPDIEGTVYFWSEGAGWSHPSDNYAYWNVTGNIGNGTQTPSDQIGVAQGFMVYATSNSASVHLDNDMRTHANPNYFKESDIASIKLSIQYQDDFYNETLIAMLEDATLAFDRDYDARKLLGDANLYLYTEMPETNQELAIQGIPFPDDSPIIIPLVVDAGISGEFTLDVVDIQNIDESKDVLLEDKQNDKFYNLKEIDQISVQLSEGVTESRFYLHFSNATGINDDIINTSNIFAYTNNKTLYIVNPDRKKGNIKIFNLKGQEVATMPLTSTIRQQQLLSLDDIINVVQIQTEDEIVSEKLIFK